MPENARVAVRTLLACHTPRQCSFCKMGTRKLTSFERATQSLFGMRPDPIHVVLVHLVVVAIFALVAKLAVFEKIEPGARNGFLYMPTISPRAGVHGMTAYVD